jgi:hypothetical protein
MSTPGLPELQATADQFSYKVSAPADRFFWFRLEREQDRDVITDYFLGGFDEEIAGRLLIECYGALGLIPAVKIIFRDILPSREPAGASALEKARSFYTACGKELLIAFGATHVDERLESDHDKRNLVLVARR